MPVLKAGQIAELRKMIVDVRQELPELAALEALEAAEQEEGSVLFSVALARVRYNVSDARERLASAAHLLAELEDAAAEE